MVRNFASLSISIHAALTTRLQRTTPTCKTRLTGQFVKPAREVFHITPDSPERSRYAVMRTA